MSELTMISIFKANFRSFLFGLSVLFLIFIKFRYFTEFTPGPPDQDNLVDRFIFLVFIAFGVVGMTTFSIIFVTLAKSKKATILNFLIRIVIVSFAIFIPMLIFGIYNSENISGLLMVAIFSTLLFLVYGVIWWCFGTLYSDAAV